jgi:hypothetical protein
LGIEHIPAYSPEARGRSERMFGTLQDRLIKELAKAGITEIAAANAWRERYEEEGLEGLLDRRLGKPSPKRVPAAERERMLDLYRGLGVQLTPSERAELELAAAEAGTGLSQYVRELCLRRAADASNVGGARRNPDSAREQ